jgi:hypothetical protein
VAASVVSAASICPLLVAAKASTTVKAPVRLVAVGEDKGELIVEGMQLFCANRNAPCGSFPYALVVGFDGKRQTWFVPKDNAEAQAYVDGLGEGPAASLEALAAYRKRHGFLGPDEFARRGKNGCRLWFDKQKRRGKDGAPSEYEYTVRVAAGLKRLGKIMLGTDALATSHQVQGMFLAGRRELLVWASLPTCRTREGACADAPEIKTVSLGPTRVPDLAVCFGASEQADTAVP